MRKSKTVGGEPCFVIKVSVVGTITSLAAALADYCYEEGCSDILSSPKRNIWKVVNNQFRLHGQNGQWEAFSGDGNGLGSGQEAWNEYYQLSVNFLQKEYPYLTP